ncbi:MAG: D-alanyl-D-alanine carboxypeptidase, partial [Muribaculaceae bacterium]|nr:D-alanyl-D-alanine carboxypeptidase [Muribaculaceae bacterium]
MKRKIVFLLLFLTATISYASPLEDFLKSRSINAASTAVLIQDLKSGKVLVSHNNETPLLPASIMKTVTIAALLEEKGADERFHTRVYADGPIRGNIIEGDLLIVGSGDPTLGAN